MLNGLFFGFERHSVSIAITHPPRLPRISASHWLRSAPISPGKYERLEQFVGNVIRLGF